MTASAKAPGRRLGGAQEAEGRPVGGCLVPREGMDARRLERKVVAGFCKAIKAG